MNMTAPREKKVEVFDSRLKNTLARIRASNRFTISIVIGTPNRVSQLDRYGGISDIIRGTYLDRS